MIIKINIKNFIIRSCFLLIYILPIWLRLLNAYGLLQISNVSAITRSAALITNILLIIVLIPKIVRNSKKNYKILGMIILFSLMIFARDNGYNMTIFSNFSGRVLPIILLYIYIGDAKTYLKEFRAVAYVVVIGAILFPFSKAYSTAIIVADWQWNYMSYGYNTIYCWTMILWEAIRETKKQDVFLSSILCLFYIIFSTRMMLLCIALIITIFVLKYSNAICKIQLSFIMMLGTTLLIGMGENIVVFINTIFVKTGITSRSFSLFTSNKLTANEGTEIIWRKIFPHLDDSIFVGNGLGYDRLLTGGNYAHNMFIEIIISFGYLCGGILCVFLIYSVVKIFKSNDEMIIGCFLVIALPGYIILQLSDSIFNVASMYITFLLYFNVKKKKKVYR